MLPTKQNLYGFCTVIFFLCLNTTAFGQATVTLEVNWPNYSNENRVTLRDPSNALIGQICDPNKCYAGNGSGNGANQKGSDQYSYTSSFNYSVPYGNGYSILLEDVIGDGWDGTGSYIRVYVDGVLTLENNGKNVNLNGINGTYINNLPRTLTFDVTTNPTAFNTDLAIYDEFPGYSDYSTAGNTLRTQPNSPGNGCAITTTSTGTLTKSIPGTATIEKAYLYWASSGIGVDVNVTLDGQAVTADQTYRSYSKFSQGYFTGGVADVTTIVQASATGTYTFSGLTIDTSLQYCSVETVLGGWSIIVFYSDPALPASSVVLYSGFKGDSGTNYAGGVATSTFGLSGFYAIGSVGSKTSVLSWEGDQTLANNESLTFTTASAGTNKLVGDGDNNGTTVDNPFNSTIFDSSAIPVVNNAAAHGMDLDTYDVSAFINAGESSVTTTVNVGQDFVIMNAVVLKVPSNLISGYVFEDINYGGGAGRSIATSSGVPLEGAIVELYDNTGTLMRTANTDASGYYLFGGMSNGTYSIRVVNSSVKSTRTGGATCTTCMPVQTFKTNFASSTLVPVTNEVGGANPGSQDVAAGTLTAAQSVAGVTIVNEGAVGVDFGFNFNTVVNSNNSGQGSLRQFIINSNALGGEGSLAQAGLTAARETSVFEIPGAGPHAISLSSSLPTITGPSTWIDAITQSGASCGPHTIKVTLNGAGIVTTGLRLKNTGQGVRGLSIGNFQSYGIDIDPEAISAQILCNHIGVDPAGSIATPNSTNNGAGVIIEAPGVAIGDGTAEGLNIISGNHHDGIAINDFTGNAALPIVILGNYIGVASDGVSALGNGTIGGGSYNGAGIEIRNSPTAYIEIGGLGVRDGNIISGNLESGVVIEDNSSSIRIRANYIGLGVDGVTSVGNSVHGINIGQSSLVSIGDGSFTGRNFISSNTEKGIYVGQSDTIFILGNYVGTAANGNTAKGNGADGISIQASQNIDVGNGALAIPMVISANGNQGIQILNSTIGINVRGSLIGLGANGTTPLGNGANGIAVGTTSNVTIGGATVNDRNTVAENEISGILFSGASTGLITNNAIYNNNNDGVSVFSLGTAVTISQNQIYNNGELGIDLALDNVTLNDTNDADTGPNGLLNFPIISAAYLSGSNLVIKGWARQGSTIELFLTDINEGTATLGDNQFGMSADYGEGQTYFDTVVEGAGSDSDASTSFYTDVDGNTDNTNRFAFTVPAPPSLALGDYITATATLASSTSEFSPSEIIAVQHVITNRRITYRVNKN